MITAKMKELPNRNEELISSKFLQSQDGLSTIYSDDGQSGMIPHKSRTVTMIPKTVEISNTDQEFID